MSTASPTLPINPVVRFRLRSLLALVTVAAVILAIAGIYYRRQTPGAQTALLVHWSVIAAFCALGAWHNWRTSWRLAPSAGTPRFMIIAPRPSSSQRWRRLRWLAPCTMLVVIAFDSHRIAGQSDQHRELMGVVIEGLRGGLILAIVLYAQLPQPTFLCDNGIASGRMSYIRWKYVRHASWLPDRPSVLKLRRYDGDLFLEIPAADRAAIDAFVREKAPFKDAEERRAENEPAGTLLAPSQ